MLWCLQSRVVADEFLFSTQPIFDIVAILPATRFVQTVGELGNLVVGRGRSTAGVCSHPPLACGMRSDETSCFCHNFLV